MPPYGNFILDTNCSEFWATETKKILLIYFSCLDTEALVGTVLETTEKILLHAQVFGKALLKHGEAKKLLIMSASMKLVWNKVMFYKKLYGHIVKKDYMEAELESTTQGLYLQVIIVTISCLSNFQTLKINKKIVIMTNSWK